MKTIEDQERHAYASGDTKLAAALAQLVDIRQQLIACGIDEDDPQYDIEKLNSDHEKEIAKLADRLEPLNDFFQAVLNAFETAGGQWPCADPEDQTLVRAICDQLMGEV